MATYPRRVGKNGKVSWQAKVRLNGVKRSKTFAKKTDAVAWATSVENSINEGKPVQQRKQLQKRIADVFDDYIASGLVSEPKKRMLRRLAIELGKLKLEDLNTKRLALYLEIKKDQALPGPWRKNAEHPLYSGGKELVKGELVQKTYKPASIRQFYYALRTALQWHARVNDYHFNEKPFKDNPPPAAWSAPRERRLEAGELERLLSACDKMYVNQEHLKDIIQFQIYSCMRAGEGDWKCVPAKRVGIIEVSSKFSAHRINPNPVHSGSNDCQIPKWSIVDAEISVSNNVSRRKQSTR
jgi:hypothetical protein